MVNSMRTYALVENGVVSNVVVWDGGEDWTPDAGVTPVLVTAATGMASAGYAYANGVFTAPAAPVVVLSLADAQAAQIAALTVAYNAAIQVPVSYMSTTFQADNGSQDRLTGSLVAGTVPAGFYWLDANNVQVGMTFAQLQGLASVMLVQDQAAFTKLQGYKTEVRAATSIAAVKAVTWA